MLTYQIKSMPGAMSERGYLCQRPMPSITQMNVNIFWLGIFCVN